MQGPVQLPSRGDGAVWREAPVLPSWRSKASHQHGDRRWFPGYRFISAPPRPRADPSRSEGPQMTDEDKFPGVYVDETETARQIDGVPTSGGVEQPDEGS